PNSRPSPAAPPPSGCSTTHERSPGPRPAREHAKQSRPRSPSRPATRLELPCPLPPRDPKLPSIPYQCRELGASHPRLCSANPSRTLLSCERVTPKLAVVRSMVERANIGYDQ